jgi:hypothetical protein
MTEIQDQILNDSLALFIQTFGSGVPVEGHERRQIFQTLATHLGAWKAFEVAWIPSEFLEEIFPLRPTGRHTEDAFARLVLELIDDFEFNVRETPHTLLLRKEKLCPSQTLREIWDFDKPLDHLSERPRDG